MKSKKQARKGSKSRDAITGKMKFSEVLNKYPETADVFFKHGMACFGCPASMMESIEDGIKAHGQDTKKIIKELNDSVKKRK